MGLGGLAGVVGRGAQKISPAIAHYSTRSTSKEMASPNPPDFKKMLSEHLYPYFGGLKGAYDRMLFVVNPLRKQLDKAVTSADERGLRINLELVRKEASDALHSDTRLTADELPDIEKKLEEIISGYEDIGKRYILAKKHKEIIPDSKALSLNRKDISAWEKEKLRINEENAQNRTRMTPFDESLETVIDRRNPVLENYPKSPIPPRPDARTEYAIEDVIEVPGSSFSDLSPSYAVRQKRALQTAAFKRASNAEHGPAAAYAAASRGMNKGIEFDTPDIRDATRLLSPYEAMISSLERRLGIPAAQNPGLGLYDFQAAQTGSDLVGSGVKGALAGFLAKRLMSTTGGAQMMYDVGGKLVSLSDLLAMRVR